MPITSEVDWLVCVDPGDFVRFCRGRLESARFHMLNVGWGRRIRHLFDLDQTAIFDEYATWVAAGGKGECRLQYESGVEDMAHYWGGKEYANWFISALTRADWLAAVGFVADSASWDFSDSRLTGPVLDPTKSHKKKSKKGREAVTVAWKGMCERYDHELKARRERTLWQFANEFRDVAGNPFHPVIFDPAWRSETVVGLATGIDEAGAYERLPILADALEETGCTDAQVLTHARGPGPHVRGCWLVDMVLGRFA